MATSSHEFVWVERTQNGKVTFLPGIRSTWTGGAHAISNQRRKDCFFLPTGTLSSPQVRNWPGSSWWDDPYNGAFRAMVPHVPPGLRPRHSLDGYATLFEVEEWAKSPAPPRDPALLKHIGGDLYAVLATWDLTELERSVLGGRLH